MIAQEILSIKIAEASGWTNIHHDPGYPWAGIPPEHPGENHDLPDYFGDRDAAFGARRLLLEDDEQCLEYMLNLMDVCQKSSDLGKWMCAQTVMDATAAQQCEALIRTLKL